MFCSNASNILWISVKRFSTFSCHIITSTYRFYYIFVYDFFLQHISMERRLMVQRNVNERKGWYGQSCTTLPASCKITDLSFVKQRITCLFRLVIIWFVKSSKWFVSKRRRTISLPFVTSWTESGRGEVSGPWKGGRTCILPFLRVFGCAFHLMQAELINVVCPR